MAQHVGAHTITGVPRKVVEYLKLEHPETYTTSMLVEGGADLLTLKRHGGWKSSTVADTSIEDSVSRKTHVSKKLFLKMTATSTSTQPTGSKSIGKQEIDIHDEELNNQNYQALFYSRRHSWKRGNW